MVTVADLLPVLRQAESGGDPNALSPKGAAGAYQIMPTTAANPGFGVTPLQGWDGKDPRTAPPAEQERFARDYLQAMSAKHNGNVELALASYNAGPGAVQVAGGVPNYPETQNYVKKITQGANVATTAVTPGNTATDWRSRAQPVQVTSDWRSRAQPVQQEASVESWRTRAQPVTEEPSTGADVGKSVASNLAKGTVDALMVLPNMLNEAAAGPQYLAKGIYDTFKGNPTDTNFQPYKPFFSSSDVVDNSMIDYQPKTTAGKVAGVASRLGANIAAPTVINKSGNAALKSKFMTDQSSKTLPLTGPTKPPVKTSSDLDKMAGDAYKLADELGSVYSANDVSIPFSKAIADIKPRPIAGKTLTSEEQKLVQHLEEYSGLKGSKLSFDEVRRLDQGLTQKINANFIDARTGQPDNNGRKLMILQTKLRTALDDIPQNAANDALRNANKLYKARIILDELDTVAERASMTQNTAQSLRTGYKNLYMDKDRIRGWPEEAKALLKKAATPGISDEFLIPLGSRMASIIGMGTGDIGGAATNQIVGMAARGGRTAVAAKQGAKVQQSIVDDALGGLRTVKMPEKSNIPLMLAAPSKMSPLPMTDTQVNIAQRLGAKSKPTGVDQSGVAIKPPVSQVGKLEGVLKDKDANAYKSLKNLFTSGEISQNQFVKTAKDQFNITETQARSLAREIKIYGKEKK